MCLREIMLKKAIEENVKQNLLNRYFNTTKPNQKWSTDNNIHNS